MKRKVLLFVISMLTLMAGRSWAGSARIYIDDFSVKQGEEINLKVMVEADVYVTQANFYLEIPDGFEFVNKGTDRRPVYGSNTENSVGLTFSSNIIGSQMRVFLSDADQIGTEEMSGELAVVYIKAKDDATIGDHVFRLTEAVASDEKATRFATPDADVKVTVYKECTISLGVNDAAYGSASITPVQDIYITGTNITVTATPNEGYKFVKWSDGTNDVSTDNPYTAEVTDDMTLMAVFAPNQYTMTFVLDNGEENVVITQDYATELTAPADPTKTGFTFKGWSPEIPATIPASDQTFTAQWERNKYKLTFVVDGAETTSDVLYEDPVTKPEDPTKEGYTFTGWDKEIPATMPAENLTITALFSINQYAMTFVLDNGDENVVKTQDYGTELAAPADPTKTGFTFKGWSPEVPATVPASDQTFTAQWERNSYKLTFIVDGVETTTDVSFEAEVTKPADPEKEGYTFTGWDKEIPATMPAEDVTITAEWTVIAYTIGYDLAGGSLAEGVSNAESYTIESEDIALNNPTREGYTFAGWTGADLSEATVAVTIAKGSTGDRSYTANWTPITYAISYELAGGSLADGVSNAESYTIESEDITLNNPTREGYTFAGWTGTGLTGTTADVTIAKGSTGDRRYTATWTINQYAMTFVLDNGEENVVKTQDYGTELTAPADPTKTGFTFKGWSPEVPATIPASDQTFTAQWERNKYKLTFVVDGAETTSDVLYEDPVTKPEDPTKEGYTFTGWDKEIPATMPAENLTITAQFSINQYTITFVLDNGEENVVMTQDYGTELTAPANPTKEGYTFKGWDKEIPATMPAENLTIKAVYEENETSEIATLLANKSFVDVYTLKGTLVGRRISVDNLNKILNRGVYIIDCVKVFIR